MWVTNPARFRRWRPRQVGALANSSELPKSILSVDIIEPTAPRPRADRRSRPMTTQTHDNPDLAAWATDAPVRPGSTELSALLDRIAVDSDLRDRDRIAPFEQIAWVKQAGLGRLRVPIAEGGGGASVR